LNAHALVLDVSEAYRLLLICVYMPYEGGRCSLSMTDEFAGQLATVDSIMDANTD